MFTAAQDLLLAYGRLANLPTLGFDEHGCARLVFEGDVAIDLEADEPAQCIQVYAVLGPVPPGDREPLYRRLLEGNLFGQQTGGATLAVDPVREEVLLCARVDPAVVSAEALVGWLDRFAGTAADWLRRYAAGELTTAPGIGQEHLPSSHWQSHFVPG
ncbi:MAG: type III secretion system chaperone [Ramlibacter sp.]